MFFAIALASMEILKWLHPLPAKRWQSAKKIAFIVLFFVLSINSLIRSTCDPLATDKWMFYSKGEKIAMEFMELNFKKTTIWSGFDERIRSAFNYQSNFDSFKKIQFTTNPNNAKYYFVSHTIKKRARRDGKEKRRPSSG